MRASRLPDLIALAQEPSSGRRRELLRELTDQFFGTPEHSPSEIDLYGAIMEKLSADMETAVRAELSTRFAKALEAPKSLIRRLAGDEIVVAKAVLESSPLLSDQDLLHVVEEQGQDHLRAVSRRESVSETVTDAIVRRGDDETLVVLLGNEGAQLSRRSAEAAVERARTNPALHAATVSRASLPPDLLNDMYFVVEQKLRQRILERNAGLDPAVLEAALARGSNRLAHDDGLLPADYVEARDYVEELSVAGQLTPPMLARLLRSASRTPFLIALSRLADVDFHTARDIVERREIDALAVVCRAANLDRALFLTYAVVLLGDEDDALAKAQNYGRLYATLEADAASRTLRFWRLRREARAA